MLQEGYHCAHLVGNLGIALQEEDRQEQRHKGQEREQLDVVLPALLLLEVPAGQSTPVPAMLSCWRSLWLSAGHLTDYGPNVLTDPIQLQS